MEVGQVSEMGEVTANEHGGMGGYRCGYWSRYRLCHRSSRPKTGIRTPRQGHPDNQAREQVVQHPRTYARVS